MQPRNPGYLPGVYVFTIRGEIGETVYRMAGPINMINIRFFNHITGIHHQHPVCDLCNDTQVVRYQSIDIRGDLKSLGEFTIWAWIMIKAVVGSSAIARLSCARAMAIITAGAST
jgi:hypothetical protein